MNRSAAARFEASYRRLWGALHRRDDPDGPGQHERELLAHIGPDGVSLTWLATHLLLPKSTASVLVKDLERRGLLTRRRDPVDERRLTITLTPAGAAIVEADTVLDLDRLDRALRRLPADDRRAVVELLDRLAEAAASLSA